MEIRHPGGEELTSFLLAMSGLEPCKILDLGAGSGHTVRYLQELGFDASGIDLNPAQDVLQGNILCTGYEDGSFDALISECVFYISGDPDSAAREAARILSPGGLLLLSDVCFTDPATHIAGLETAGFRVLHVEDATELWREYYLECIWKDEIPLCLCGDQKKKCRYFLTICERM